MKEPKYIVMIKGEITYEEGGKTFQVPDTAKVSMNFWCFDPSVFTFIEKIFKEFLAKSGQESKIGIFYSHYRRPVYSRRKGSDKNYSHSFQLVWCYL